MATVSQDGPFTAVGDLLPGEMDREAKRLVAQGFAEARANQREQLLPRQFFRIKTRAGTPAEERWQIVRRNK